MYKLKALGAALLLLNVEWCLAATPRQSIVYQTVDNMTIDGKLHEQTWLQIPWSEAFMDIEGSAKPRPRFFTNVKMAWDQQYFYVAAFLEEPHVWATLSERDSVIFYDNDFEIFIDPNGDNWEYYEVEVNALGTVWDLFLPKPYRDGGGAVNSWNIEDLKLAVSIDGTLNDPSDQDRGWTVEMAIPWRAFAKAHQSLPPEHGDQWRINFSRVEWQHTIANGRYVKQYQKNEDNWVWSPQAVIDMHRPERWGYVQFSKQDPQSSHFLEDKTWQQREILHLIYYAQKSYYRQWKKWASDIQELGLGDVWPQYGTQKPSIVLKDDGYSASVGGLSIDHQSLLQVGSEKR